MAVSSVAFFIHMTNMGRYSIYMVIMGSSEESNTKGPDQVPARLARKKYRPQKPHRSRPTMAELWGMLVSLSIWLNT